MIELRNATKEFGSGDTTVRAVDDVSFVQPSGTFWALMGPSGSGKSTILHLIAGLTPVTAGQILVEGTNVAHMSRVETAALRRRRVGYVLQHHNLLPDLTAAQNVAMPLILDGCKSGAWRPRSTAALELAGIAHRAEHLPDQLSGGEQQRVALARALVIEPAIILADEPTGNLDRRGGEAVMDLIRDINERLGVTVLLVTHDPVFAGVSSRVLRLVDGRLTSAVDLPKEPLVESNGGTT